MNDTLATISLLFPILARRARGAVLPLVLASALGGCAEPAPPEAPLVELQEKLIFEQPLLVVPGARFEAQGAGRISFRNRASLLFWVHEPLDQPLVVRFLPHRESAGQYFGFEWDDAPFPADRIEHSEAGVRLRFLPDDLPPGRHRLRILRNHSREQVAVVRKNPESVFREIRYRIGETRTSLDFERFERDQLIAGFLQHGVIGHGKEHRSGLLFVGPVSHAVRISRRGRSTLRFETENFSAQKATFRLGGAVEQEIEVGPGQRAMLAANLEAGEHELRFAVEGAADGVYLWGMPIAEDPRLDLAPIILITLDTTRRDALGPYRGHGPSNFEEAQDAAALAGLTPHLDQLASEATVYDRAFSTAPWTLPSHASIFTGLYPSKHGAGVSEAQLMGDTPLLARQLRDQGYLTAGFSSGDLSSSRFGLAQGFHYYRDPDEFETLGGQLDGYLQAFLDDYGSLPLFLFINYFDAHALYQAPSEYAERLGVPALAERLAGPAWDDLLAGRMSGWRQLVEGEVQPTPAGIRYLRSAYLAEVAFVDHLLGRLFERLKELGIYERALIVVTADHGELIGEDGYFSHAGRLDPELVEIPLIVKWPGQEEGRRESRVVSLVDLFPTVLRAAGVEPPPSDGKNLSRSEQDRGEAADDRHPFVLFEEHASMVHPLPKHVTLARHLYGVQRPDFRQVVWETAQNCERRGATGWEEVDCEAEIEEVLAAVRARLGEQDYADGEAPLSDEVTESLKALGYM